MKHYPSYQTSRTSGVSVQYYINSFLRKLEFVILVIACIGLIVISKIHKPITDKISLTVVEFSTPVSNAILAPFGFVKQGFVYLKDLSNVRQENALLKAENEKLKSVFIKALNISQENDELKQLLNFVSTRSVTFNTARLVITRPNQFYGNNIFINAGAAQGIEENSVVTGSKSVIGRAVNVGKNISQILSITDSNSKIPIVTSKSKDRGILTGHNTRTMTIEYLDNHHNIAIGDLVFTSGDGEYLPPGLLIGVVTKASEHRVEVEAAENINNVTYVTIFKYSPISN